ncbi:hypothetical protein LguiA_017672 [Lonicera macranthoides]
MLSFDPRLFQEAITSTLQKMMREELGGFKEQVEEMSEELKRMQVKVDRVESTQIEQSGKSHNAQRSGRPQPRERRADFDNYYRDSFDDGDSDVDSVIANRRNGRRFGRGSNREDDNMNGIKMRIPSFQGKNDPEAYLEWVKKVELVFACHNYSESKKVKLAAIKFFDYALVWWDRLMIERKRSDEGPVETWDEMKWLMKKRFVPDHYYRELYQKLQGLTQGNRSVDEYYKEMEVAMIRAKVDENREATMARFLSGLNREIANAVELQPYVEIEDMVHTAIKIERQLKRRGGFKPNQSSYSTPWKQSPWKKDDKATTPKSKVDSKSEVPSGGQAKTAPNTTNTPTTRNRDIICWKCQGRGHVSTQCPNKRVMMLLDNREYETDEEGAEAMTPLEDVEGEESAIQGELLVARRALSTQVKEDEEQRKNIFHTRCLVLGKVCSLVIDGGSCTNVASTTKVEKLALHTTKHPRPYKLQWLNDSGEVRVNKQVLVSFSIGKYEDQVLCDVVPMQAGHMLLGRPWQYDRRVKHDGFTNKYSFEMNKRTIILAPLPPQQAYADQLKLQSEEEQRRAEKKKRDSGEEKKESEGKRKELEKKERRVEKPVTIESKFERRQKNFYARASEVKRAMLCNQLLVLVYKEALLNSNELNSSLPSVIVSLLQDFGDVFLEDTPSGLPPI